MEQIFKRGAITVFKSKKDREMWCAEWEAVRAELLKKHRRRLENIYLAKEEKK